MQCFLIIEGKSSYEYNFLSWIFAVWHNTSCVQSESNCRRILPLIGAIISTVQLSDFLLPLMKEAKFFSKKTFSELTRKCGFWDFLRKYPGILKKGQLQVDSFIHMLKKYIKLHYNQSSKLVPWFGRSKFYIAFSCNFCNWTANFKPPQMPLNYCET